MEFHIGMGRSETIHEIGPLARIAEDAGFTHITSRISRRSTGMCF